MSAIEIPSMLPLAERTPLSRGQRLTTGEAGHWVQFEAPAAFDAALRAALNSAWRRACRRSQAISGPG
ncbi:MAG: hypothetical protein QM772_18760 [Ottowia sp.]|uniref:hypothetical protein n=1 Tax=Ottowia sp. TaxID=1898956 RepID=UPI0039E6AF45